MKQRGEGAFSPQGDDAETEKRGRSSTQFWQIGVTTIRLVELTAADVFEIYFYKTGKRGVVDETILDNSRYQARENKTIHLLRKNRP